MEHQVFKLKSVGRMGKLRLGPDYMEGVNRRVKRLTDALKADPRDDRQLRLPGLNKTKEDV